MPSSASASSSFRHRRPSHDAAMDHRKSTNNGTVSNHHHQHYHHPNPNTMTRSADDDENRPPMMDDVMDLFTSTLQSLAADAACVREITSLAELTGVLSSSSSSLATTSFHRQSHDGGDDNEERRRQQRRYYQQKLVDLDRLIAGMEQKVVAMRGIINEESQAISKFETTLQHEALQQDSIIQELLSLVMLGKEEDDDDDNDEEDTDENGVNTSNDGTYKDHHRGVLKSRQQPAMSLNRSAKKSSLDSQNSGRGSLSKRRFHATRSFDSADEQDFSGDDETVDQERPSEIVFEEVMESELLELKRNVPFGLRVSRYDLNDTMEQIQQVLERKMALEERSATHPERLRTPSNSMQRRYDYLRQRKHGSYDAIETDAHSQHWWVTEQELREKCTFFRHGESSARGILSTLCSLRRLKQVPGKNREVTYLWL